MTLPSKVRLSTVCAALGLGLLMLPGCSVAQDLTPTPNSSADIFDPALAEATPIPGIEKIRSSFALKQVRYKTALPLPVR